MDEIKERFFDVLILHYIQSYGDRIKLRQRQIFAAPSCEQNNFNTIYKKEEKLSS
jgi:hypothetical protein